MTPDARPDLPLGVGGRGIMSRVSLRDLEQLRLDFNAHVDRRRLLSLVSPTCDDCRAGLNLVRDTMADAEEVVRFVLWLAMRDGDTVDAALEAAEQAAFGNRERSYWEGEGWPVSTRMRPVLGLGAYDPTRSAWDIHLWYARGITWDGEDPPTPSAWVHNLRDDPGMGERLDPMLLRRWLADPH
jgi:hypothetical protein